MVWFDCECGESLKKPSVAKHFMHKRCSRVSCVDCSVTFEGNDFELHTKCISEAQKYMGKLYQADSKQEGAKQDDWIISVSKALGAYKGLLSHYVERLQQYDNIPRKQRAFENFVANSLNLKREPSTVTKLWQIVEQCLKKNSGPTEQIKQGPIAWKSYEEETEEVLKRHGGKLSWKLLQANVSKRRKSTHPTEDYETIRLNVLANIPEKYLSGSSNIVAM